MIDVHGVFTVRLGWLGLQMPSCGQGRAMLVTEVFTHAITFDIYIHIYTWYLVHVFFGHTHTYIYFFHVFKIDVNTLHLYVHQMQVFIIRLNRWHIFPPSLTPRKLVPICPTCFFSRCWQQRASNRGSHSLCLHRTGAFPRLTHLLGLALQFKCKTTGLEAVFQMIQVICLDFFLPECQLSPVLARMKGVCGMQQGWRVGLLRL